MNLLADLLAPPLNNPYFFPAFSSADAIFLTVPP
uniref:Uncharacterized protein n=1 Tax=virus sp. ctML55 TaxID=2827627 RepID=A0A8S5RI44_9VIRU|nr:MAG TPA: hypothetical protein [virus sp. ctML55]DAE99291.1 MAG TPA: hypothetical protein [Caudoviricetes sp.]DAJ95454.1 MAG TPA: hypothetical protein [Caudoviricetes sp.]